VARRLRAKFSSGSAVSNVFQVLFKTPARDNASIIAIIETNNKK
jgi:hypothetical protein